MASMQVVGLLGGVCSGKSMVASQLCRRGAALLDGDRAGHKVLRGADVQHAVRQRWGDRVFNDKGEIDRQALGQIVFARSPAGRADLEHLERLTHPKITELLRRQIEALRADGTRVAVLDAAVMVKAGWHELCDKILFVESPRSQRVARAAARGWSEADFEAREEAQESLDQKRRLADVVLVNSGSVESTNAQVASFWQSLDS